MGLALLVFFAFLVEAVAGFGSMVIALSVGALWFDVEQLLTWLVPVNVALSAYLVTRDARFIRWRFLLIGLLPVMGVGLLGGSLVAARAGEAAWLKPSFGLFVIAIAAWQLVRGQPRALSPLMRNATLLAAGVVHGVFATGGPLAVFVASRELEEKRAFRGTLSMLWLVLNALVLPRLALTTASLQTSAVMLLPLAVGIGVGEFAHRSIDEARFRVGVNVLLLLAGLTLTITTLTQASE